MFIFLQGHQSTSLKFVSSQDGKIDPITVHDSGLLTNSYNYTTKYTKLSFNAAKKPKVDKII